MKRSAALFFALIILILSLASCSERSQVSCREILQTMTESEIGLPAGRYYSLSAPEGDGEYVSEQLLRALYGGDPLPKIAENWIDYAAFFSTASSPCEFTVVCCSDHDTAKDTARLFSARLNSIKSVKYDERYASMTEQATVTVRGNFVIFIISSDSKNALTTAKEMLK